MPERLLEYTTFADGQRLPRLIPGPMDGVTEGSFVSVLSRRKYVWSWHTPFLRISTGVPGRSRLRAWLEPYKATGLPVTVQIMGTSEERLAETASRLHELGVACVDLNCACPSPTVVGNGSGGARLQFIDWLERTFRMIRMACGTHGFSVKVRIGYSSPEEFPHIAEALRAGRPDMVIVHYRTVSEMYHPIEGGLERLASARQLLKGMTMYGSGDLYTPEDCVNMVLRTDVDGVAPARGLIVNPRLLVETQQLVARRRNADSPCGIDPLPPFDALQYLLEITEEADRHAGANNGFVLRMAKAVAGQNSGLFRALAEWRTLDRTAAGLREWLNKTGD